MPSDHDPPPPPGGEPPRNWLQTPDGPSDQPAPPGSGTTNATGEVSGEQPDGTFSTPRRLHPASVLLGVPLAQAVQALIFPVVATLAAPLWVTLTMLSVLAVVGLILRSLDWRMRTFSFDGEVLRVDHGVLSRNHRSLDVGRIQQVEIQRGAVQRLFGLAAIRVETAGSAAEPEVDLRVVPEQDAVALRAAVRASQRRRRAADDDRGAPEQPEDDDGEVVLTVPMSHVVIAAVTGARLLVLPAVIGGALQFVGNQIGPFVDDLVDQMIDMGLAVGDTPSISGPDWRLVALGASALLVLSVLAAIVVGVLRDGNFRIRRVDDDLYVSRGLLSTRDSVVPLRRVQLVEIKRNWVRRLLGFATVRIRSAGGSTGGDGRVTVPLLPVTDVDRLLGEIMPNVEGVPRLRSHPPAALRRSLFRWLRPAAALVAAVWFAPDLLPFVDTDGLVASARPWILLLLPLNAVLAVVEYRQLAHGLTERVVAARSGALSISTDVAPVVKVQAVTSRRSLFQRRLDLTTLLVHVAGPGALVTVLDAGRAAAQHLHERLSEHAASPTPVIPAQRRVGGDAREPGDIAGTADDRAPADTDGTTDGGPHDPTSAPRPEEDVLRS